MQYYYFFFAQCLSTARLPEATVDTLASVSNVFDYCTLQLRLPRLTARPPVVNVADAGRANDVVVPETGDDGRGPKVFRYGHYQVLK